MQITVNMLENLNLENLFNLKIFACNGTLKNIKFKNLPKIQKLRLIENFLTKFPNIFELKSLTVLVITNSDFVEIPPEISQLTNLTII
jgi:Leucine-rich repeat (LRR) protein